MTCDYCEQKHSGDLPFIDVSFKRHEVRAVIEGHPAHMVTREMVSHVCCSINCAVAFLAKYAHLMEKH